MKGVHVDELFLHGGPVWLVVAQQGKHGKQKLLHYFEVVPLDIETFELLNGALGGLEFQRR